MEIETGTATYSGTDPAPKTGTISGTDSYTMTTQWCSKCQCWVSLTHEHCSECGAVIRECPKCEPEEREKKLQSDAGPYWGLSGGGA